MLKRGCQPGKIGCAVDVAVADFRIDCVVFSGIFLARRYVEVVDVDALVFRINERQVAEHQVAFDVIYVVACQRHFGTAVKTVVAIFVG